MSLLRYTRMELARLFKPKLYWLMVLLTTCTPLLGLTPLISLGSTTQAAQYLAEPILATTLLSMILWGLYTILSLDRAYKARVTVLTDAVASPLLLASAQVAALLLAALAAGVISALVHLPWTAIKLGIVFELGDYAQLHTVFVIGGMWIAVLLCAALYQILRRVDLSAIAFIALVFISRSEYLSANYILRFTNPILITLSDDFSNAWPLRLAAYNRLFWLLLAGGLYLLSLLCVRRYGKGILGSFGSNLRKGTVALVLAAALVGGSAGAYAFQPYANHAPGDLYDHDCEYNESAFLRSTHTVSQPDIRSGRQSGVTIYHVENDNTEPYEQKLYMRCGYTVQSIHINGEAVPFTDLDDDVMWDKHIVFTMPAERELEIVVEYGGMPRLWITSPGSALIGAAEIERRYIAMSSSAFAPVMELYPPEDQSGYNTTAEVTLPGNLTPILTGGEAEMLHENEDGTKLWRFASTRYALRFVAADYVCQRVPLKDRHVEFYYSRKHEKVLEQFGVADVLRETMLYGLDTIGTPPWFAEYETLKLVQETAHSPGGGASRGISTMYEDVFSADALSDPLRGAGPAEVLAHEILHQWWGLGRMMTDMYDYTLEPGWNAEGLTVYSTYRLMKDRYGEAYAKEHYVDQWQAEVDAQRRDFYVRHPEYLDILPDVYADNIRAGDRTIFSYCEIPLRILKAEGLVGGETEMDRILQHLFSTEDLEYPPYLSYQDFLDACGLRREDVEV